MYMPRYEALFIEDREYPENDREFKFSFDEKDYDSALDTSLQHLNLLKRKYRDVAFQGVEEVKLPGEDKVAHL